MEQIISRALPDLTESSRPQEMEDDWISNFFDKCRIISDEEMQVIWAKLLAGEANVPGTYSRRTVNLLESLDKKDAKMFTALCGFCVWILNDRVPLVLNLPDHIYKDAGINFDAMLHLDAIGLVTFAPVGGFTTTQLPPQVTVKYHGAKFVVNPKTGGNGSEGNEIPIGQATLTAVGGQLASICNPEPLPGFVEYISNWWKQEGYNVSPYP